MRILGVMIICTTLTSCATIFSRKTYNLKITSISPRDKVLINDSLYSLPASVKIKRSKADLNIQLLSDTVAKEIKVKSSLSPRFLFGNIVWIYAMPAAYLIDLTNQKLFYYGRSIHLNKSHSSEFIAKKPGEYFRSYFLKKYPSPKGQIILSASIPFVNSFYFKPVNETSKSSIGFGGISAGLEYCYKDNSYISLTAIGAINYLLPFPAAIDYDGEHESLTSIYLSFTHNHVINRFHLGYGVNFSSNRWSLNYYGQSDDTTAPAKDYPIRKSNQSLGLTLNAYQQVSKHFLIGVVYRPTLLTVSPTTELKYEHLISLDLKWRFVLKSYSL